MQVLISHKDALEFCLLFLMGEAHQCSLPSPLLLSAAAEQCSAEMGLFAPGLALLWDVGQCSQAWKMFQRGGTGSGMWTSS